MITAGAAGGIALVALGLVLTPGPNMVYLVSRSVSTGTRAGLVSLVGVAAGFGVHLTVTAVGLGAALAAVPTAFVVLKALGAGYLLVLAWQAFRGPDPFTRREVPAERPARLVLMGFVTNACNPKIAVLYVALLPQFIEPARGSVAVQSLQLGAVQIAVALTVNAAIVLLAGRLAAGLARRPRWLSRLRRALAAVLAGLAVHLLFARVSPHS